jgi:hypothetical protein
VISVLESACAGHFQTGLVVFTLDRELLDHAVAAPRIFHINTILNRLKASGSRLLNRLFMI